MWMNAPVLAVDLAVSDDAAAGWLPNGLRLTRPARATIFVADYRETSFGVDYREAGILLHVRLGFRRAVHGAWMLVDDDVALILGREYLGFPKKLGAISLEYDKDRVTATVERKGTRLVEITGALGAEERSPPPMFGRTIVNVWGQLGLCRSRPPEEIMLARTADVDVAIRGSRQDPIDELDCGRVLGARLYRVNFGGGRALPLPVWPVNPMYLYRNWDRRFG